MPFRILVATSTLFLAFYVLAVSSYGSPTLVAIAAGFWVVGAVFQERSPLSAPVLVYIGKRSYALYLWHGAFAAWVSAMDYLPGIALAFACSFAAAELSYRFVERPALRFKDRLHGHQPDLREQSQQPAVA